MAGRYGSDRIALVVDDDANFRECLRMMLRVGSFGETLGASDVDEALELTLSRRIDLIVSDWNMQPRDGLDFLRAVRANPLTRDIPFILVTASLSEDAWRGAIEFGASDFLLKPFTIGQLHDSADLCLALEERRRAWSNVLEFRRKSARRRVSG
jgi:two-component system chemotaxis response regulator CheY